MNGVNEESIPQIVTPIQVMFFDTDCAAMVHNLAYLRFIETARTLLAEQMGMNLRSMSEGGEFPIVVRTEIDYRSSAVLADRLEVHGRLEKMQRSRFWVALEIIRPEDGKLIVTCRQMLALIRMPGGKVMRMPVEWLEKYGHLR
ncbi:MAG TPA: thioesterase family protein [Chthoniobacterales bacterium]